MNHYSNMSTLEYFLTCFAIAGVLWIFTCYTPTTYDTIPVVMNCPSLAIKHGVGSDLKTYVQAVDRCAESLNITLN